MQGNLPNEFCRNATVCERARAIYREAYREETEARANDSMRKTESRG